MTVRTCLEIWSSVRGGRKDRVSKYLRKARPGQKGRNQERSQGFESRIGLVRNGGKDTDQC